ncbi:flagellin N-terminal helical domain-containing protein [Lederbergia lenta]|uniref:Flagellin n=1 Tax=Lederbergia lenta TaxID=1467 RepID=A0A2X4WQR0_LEDLE|nr:flagellin [Lederbergia lenta]MEC2322896.1 flagellin [Lederbergia lenta]SQI61988.1 flagellin domain-containing protein [Lederbergia lenta]
MIINHNIAALNTHRQLGAANGAQGKSMEKLASGMRINRAGDDAAGLAISEKMRAQVKGLDQASRNSQDAISMIQTAEGALNETHSILQRMRELAVQSSNDTNTADDRAEIQLEIDDLIEEVDRIATTTQFNSQNLLDQTGGATGAFTFQIGANTTQTLEVTFADMQSAALGIDAIDLGTDSATSTAAIKTIDDAIKLVSDERAQMGAKQNRLEHTINNLGTASENLTAAESRIRDVDMAKEIMEQTKNSILSQAAQAMLAQANQAPQGVLQLLR